MHTHNGFTDFILPCQIWPLNMIVTSKALSRIRDPADRHLAEGLDFFIFDPADSIGLHKELCRLPKLVFFQKFPSKDHTRW